MKGIRWIVMVLMVATTAVSTISCNTVRGVGRDIEKGGEAIQDASDDAEH